MMHEDMEAAEPPDRTKQLTGLGPPAGGLGEIGDFYMDNGSGEVFRKTGAKIWTSVEQWGEYDDWWPEDDFDDDDDES